MNKFDMKGLVTPPKKKKNFLHLFYNTLKQINNQQKYKLTPLHATRDQDFLGINPLAQWLAP